MHLQVQAYNYFPDVGLLAVCLWCVRMSNTHATVVEVAAVQPSVFCTDTAVLPSIESTIPGAIFFSSLPGAVFLLIFYQHDSLSFSLEVASKKNYFNNNSKMRLFTTLYKFYGQNRGRRRDYGPIISYFTRKLFSDFVYIRYLFKKSQQK